MLMKNGMEFACLTRKHLI